MRSLVLGVVLAMAVPRVASAESAEVLRARGEQLAKDGRYSEAIDAFKAAERLEPRARHACLVALAYTRREAWPQAEIFLEQCERRATAADPLPEWVPLAKQQLAERLAAANVAAIELRVEPASVEATLSVSSFAPDETFGPRTIHLPPGRHVIRATAPGRPAVEQAVEVVDRAPQQVTLVFPAPAADPAPAPPAERPREVTRRRSKLPYVVIAAGGAIAVAGGVFHATAYRSARNALVDAETMTEYDARVPTFESRRTATIVLYAAGALTIGAGVVLKLLDAPVGTSRVGVGPTADGGAMVTVGWTR